MRSQLNMSMAQLNQLESLNCQLRDQVLQHQTQMASMQRNLEEEASRCQDLISENGRLVQAQAELQSRSQMMSCLVARPLTEELLAAEEIDQPEVEEEEEVDATLDDFQEISIPNTPTVLDGCADVFEEHFKVLESLESYLETQHLVAEEENLYETPSSSLLLLPTSAPIPEVSLLVARVVVVGCPWMD